MPASNRLDGADARNQTQAFAGARLLSITVNDKLRID
jgi:hypothetical protein